MPNYDDDSQKDERAQKPDSEAIQELAKYMHNALGQGNNRAWAQRFGYNDIQVVNYIDPRGQRQTEESNPAYGFRRLVLDAATLIDEGTIFLPQYPLDKEMGKTLANISLKAYPGDFLRAQADVSGWERALDQLNQGSVFVLTVAEKADDLEFGQEPLVMIAMLYVDGSTNTVFPGGPVESANLERNVNAMYAVARKSNLTDLKLGQAVLDREKARNIFGSDTINLSAILGSLKNHAFKARRNSAEMEYSPNSPWRIVFPEPTQPNVTAVIEVSPPHTGGPRNPRAPRRQR